MIKYLCKTCNKEFKQKIHFINHTEKKKYPCNTNIVINTSNSLKIPQNPSNFPQNPSNFPQNPSLITQKPNKYECNFCKYLTNRKDNFKRHMSICKIRKEENYEKEEIFKDLIQKYEEMKYIMTEKNTQINILTKEIELLKQNSDKKFIKTTNGTINNNNGSINNGTVNNGTVNNTINIIQHGKEDLSKIGNDVFINAFLKHTRIKIPEKIIEGIHFNDKYPEFKNIYISDINREKMMLHNGDKWVLTQSDDITSNLLDKSINFSENRYELIEDNIEKKVDVKTKNKIKKGLQIIDMIKDFDELDELDEEDEEGNQLDKKNINRRKGLRVKAIQNIKLLLYNNRNNIIES